MAQPNTTIATASNIKHRTATLDGVHNKNKALYRLGVTAAEIHRSKALLTMGGSEDTYQQSLMYLNRNHQPTVSHSFVSQKPIKVAGPLLVAEVATHDPLESEYTRHSNTADTIDQSLLEKRESASYSITWTHSQNHSHQQPRSNKSKSITEAVELEHDSFHDEKKDEVLRGLKSVSVESDSRSDRFHETHILDELFNDVNHDTNPIVSKKLYVNNHNNHNVIIPRIYHRKYEPKKTLRKTPKDWYQFNDDNNDKRIEAILQPKYIGTEQKQRDISHNSHSYHNNNNNSGYQSRRKTRNRKRNKITIDEKQKEKQKERDRWKQNREKSGYAADANSSDVNSSAKVLKFFGDDLQNKTKVNWKIGATLDEMMKMRSLGLVNITEKDDEMRKKERKTFSRKAKFIEKISKIKMKFGSKASSSISPKNNLHDIESRKFLNNYNSSPSDLDVEEEEEEEEKEENMDAEQEDECKISNYPLINDDSYHIDQSVFSFQDPDPHACNASNTSHISRNNNKTQEASIASNIPWFLNKKLRKKNNILVNKYGFNQNGKVNINAINQQICGLRKLLAEKRTLSEIISIYCQQYGFCVEFVVYLIATIDETCAKYICVISRHVDKQMKLLHGLSIWQYILRHQLPQLDIKRFFYSFGPLIGTYKTLISPLHLSARKLIEIGGGKESHITSTTSSPDCLYAFMIFKWLLFIGYDINDGDVNNLITPQTILNHAPRILKQILSYKRQFLFKQRQCMKAVDNTTYRTYKILLDDDILQVIEKFTFNQYRRAKTGFAHKKFVKAS